jgi:chromosome segregation and condensation protein ScpB
MNSLAHKIEGLLFYEGGTMTKKALKAALGCEDGALVVALSVLTDSLASRPLRLYESASDVSLRASPEMAEFLAVYDTRAASEGLGTAGLEVLAVLLYRGSSSQAEIDSVRGVNSAISLRTLRMRGLITKDEPTEGTGLRPTYSLTADALANLGCSRRHDAPDYADIAAKLAGFEERFRAMSVE